MLTVIQITPQMRVLVAIESADFRCGIDGLARRCRAVMKPRTMAVGKKSKTAM